jgi:Tfp pilus assembly protein PilX
MRIRTVLANERGIALLTVLAVLAMLLILSSLVAGSARVESQLSGVSRQGERAFAAADAGLGLALGDADNFVQLQAPAASACGVCGRCTPDLAAAGLPVTGNVCATFKYMAPPPIELHVSALHFKGFFFDVAATGTAATNAQSNLDMIATRLGPAP